MKMQKAGSPYPSSTTLQKLMTVVAESLAVCPNIVDDDGSTDTDIRKLLSKKNIQRG